MKAAQLVKPGDFQFIEVPEPGQLGPEDALVQVDCVGICGTDYGGYLGKMPFFSYPRIPGHELGVEVLQVGAEVTNVAPGMRCAVEPYINCRRCHSCVRGFTNCCENHQTLGVHCDGGLRRRFVVPGRKLHPAPHLSPAQCALVETLAIGCHAIDRGAPRPGETVLVIGAGPIGLSVIEFAKISGARTLVADTNERRLEFVRSSMGIKETFLVDAQQSHVAAISAATEGRFCEVVVDATGHPGSMSAALGLCSFAGRLVYVGITQAEITFPHAPIMHRRELTLLASRNALSKDFTRIIDLIGKGTIDTRPWITHTARFDDMLEAFPTWLKPETGVIKAVVDLS